MIVYCSNVNCRWLDRWRGETRGECRRTEHIDYTNFDLPVLRIGKDGGCEGYQPKEEQTK